MDAQILMRIQNTTCYHEGSSKNLIKHKCCLERSGKLAAGKSRASIVIEMTVANATTVGIPSTRKNVKKGNLFIQHRDTTSLFTATVSHYPSIYPSLSLFLIRTIYHKTPLLRGVSNEFTGLEIRLGCPRNSIGSVFRRNCLLDAIIIKFSPNSEKWTSSQFRTFMILTCDTYKFTLILVFSCPSPYLHSWPCFYVPYMFHVSMSPCFLVSMFHVSMLRVSMFHVSMSQYLYVSMFPCFQISVDFYMFPCYRPL
jgi:hypothetical protein